MRTEAKEQNDVAGAIVLGLLLAGLSAAGSAQEGATAQSEQPVVADSTSSPAGEQVVVTGSRIPQPQNEVPQEVKVYSREEIDESGGSTLAEFLNTLPDVSLSINENGFQTLSGTTTVQLHGLPVGTTLVLINGRRVGTSGVAQAYNLTYFDLNTIPLAAVDRIEVLPQGSSAVYGSDAIAGVVNVILKKDFTGFEANSKYGFASHHHETSAELAWGHRWDKGSVGIIGNFLTRTELRGYDRALTSDQNFTRYGGPNSDLYMCPNQANIYSLSGSNLPGIGAPYAAVPSGYKGIPSQAEFSSTAGILNQCGLLGYTSTIQGTDRGGALLEGNYHLTESAELYSNVILSHAAQYGYGNPPILYGAPGFQQFTVGAANPYNPFGQSVGVSDMLSDLGREQLFLRTNYLDAVVGARGHVSASWSWDIAIADSEDRTHYTQTDLNVNALQAALNSSDPATALNVFVNGPPAPLQVLQSGVAQDVFAYHGRARLLDAIFRGPLFDLPAGPLQTAFGAEYERDNLYQNGFFFPGPATVTDFYRHTYALFAEGRLPLIGRAANWGSGGNRLDATLAGRFDHDNEFGGKATPQFALEARPFRPVLVRASFARAFRAPDLIALYATRRTGPIEVADPLRGNAIETVTGTVGGNPQLEPETGLSRSVGIVFASEARPELRLAVTHWNIREANNIQQLAPQAVVDNAALFPGAVTRPTSCQGGPPCPISAVVATYVNFGNLEVAGFDYELIYRQKTGLGTFTPSIAATQTYRYSVALTPASGPVNGAGAAQDTGDWSPRWKGTMALKWDLRNWSTYLAGRYVGHYQDYDSTRFIGNFWLVDANVRYALGKVVIPSSQWENLYVRIGAVNLFNKLPQFSNYDFGGVGYDPTQSDIRGRFLYAQLGTRW